MPGRFILSILGSASAKPSLKRQSSAQLLQAAERLFLIDCSEDTQRRLVIQNERLVRFSRQNGIQGIRHINSTRIDAIFISHVHSDHMSGLFPLLDTMGLNGRTRPVEIFGPANLGPILTFYKSFWGQRSPYELRFTPIKAKSPEVILDYPDLTVEAFPLKHGIDTFGFLFREKLPPARQDPTEHLRSFAYCSDTAPFDALPDWIRGVDLLYHEATYMKDDFRKAALRFHSTTVDAAEMARAAEVGHLIAGHYSSSIKENEIHSAFETEMRAIFPNSAAVDDGDIFSI